LARCDTTRFFSPLNKLGASYASRSLLSKLLRNFAIKYE
jgi:hypothetical protein